MPLGLLASDVAIRTAGLWWVGGRVRLYVLGESGEPRRGARRPGDARTAMGAGVRGRLGTRDEGARVMGHGCSQLGGMRRAFLVPVI